MFGCNNIVQYNYRDHLHFLSKISQPHNTVNTDQLHRSVGLPTVATPNDVLWSDSSDDSPTRQYRACVARYHYDV